MPLWTGSRVAIFASLGLASPARLIEPCKLTLSSLQRKNGLFKKAYELGVLCSVDVAVIIFGALSLEWYCAPANYITDIEYMHSILHLHLQLHLRTNTICYPVTWENISAAEERPGHQVKLYQYCSGDVDGIVQRHLKVCLLFSPPTEQLTNSSSI